MTSNSRGTTVSMIYELEKLSWESDMKQVDTELEKYDKEHQQPKHIYYPVLMMV